MGIPESSETHDRVILQAGALPDGASFSSASAYRPWQRNRSHIVPGSMPGFPPISATGRPKAFPGTVWRISTPLPSMLEEFAPRLCGPQRQWTVRNWRANLKKVHARFTGRKGTFAHFGDSITDTMAFWTPLQYTRKNGSQEMEKAFEGRQAYLRPECWRDWKGPEIWQPERPDHPVGAEKYRGLA